MTRPRAALSGAAADQFEIELCQPVEHGQHQTPVRGRSVGHASARDRNPAFFFSVDRRKRVQQIAGQASRVTNQSRRRGRSAFATEAAAAGRSWLFSPLRH